MQNLPTIKLSELTSIYSTVSLINKFIHYPIKERITITIDFKGEFVNPICLGLVASALQLLKSNYKEVLINLVNTDSIIFGYAKGWTSSITANQIILSTQQNLLYQTI
ncbi:MAG: hypothetical protein O9302_14840 [Cyclobacteriaceae bacterium]|jgi:hypothetical protein|nr:hypothetical protein [Cytophagales bacterium]MCZ8329339.1 hypothetical protein [Cyclobacteriaceae bacterium]